MIEIIISIVISAFIVAVWVHLFYTRKYAKAQAEIDKKSVNIDAIIIQKVAEVEIKAEREKAKLERETRMETIRFKESLAEAIEKKNSSTQKIMKSKRE
jgi:hypothetical protein